MEEQLIATDGGHEGRRHDATEFEVTAMGEVATEHQQRLALDERGQENQHVAVVVQQGRQVHRLIMVSGTVS